MKYKAIIFDLDGTLLDTIDDLADSMNHVLTSFGFPIHSIEAYKIFVGDGLESLVKKTIPDTHQDEKTILACMTAMREEYGNGWARKTQPYLGIPELLNSLRELRIPISILSNKPDELTKKAVSYFLSDWDFEFVFGARNSIPIKPDPSTALEIAQTLRLNPSKFLLVGDTNTDMATATSSKMYPVGVLWGFRTANELLHSGAKSLLEYPAELLKLL